MKDVATPVPQHEVRGVIKKCLENAALVNYERLSEEARVEGEGGRKRRRELRRRSMLPIQNAHPFLFCDVFFFLTQLR